MIIKTNVDINICNNILNELLKTEEFNSAYTMCKQAGDFLTLSVHLDGLASSNVITIKPYVELSVVLNGTTIYTYNATDKIYTEEFFDRLGDVLIAHYYKTPTE